MNLLEEGGRHRPDMFLLLLEYTEYTWNAGATVVEEQLFFCASCRPLLARQGAWGVWVPLRGGQCRQSWGNEAIRRPRYDFCMLLEETCSNL